MFTAAPLRNDILCLYYANRLVGPWIEHPESPLIKNNAHVARSGGRVLNVDGRIIRYAQDDEPTYGSQVRAFEITTLSRTHYREHEVLESPIIKAGNESWNKKGMHTIDAHKIGHDQWIGAVDGFKNDFLFVGLNTQSVMRPFKIEIKKFL